MSIDRLQTSATAHEPNGSESAIRAECEQLRRRVAELERELDQYRQALYRCAGKLFTEEELRSIPNESDCLPLKDFLSELEQAVRGPDETTP